MHKNNINGNVIFITFNINFSGRKILFFKVFHTYNLQYLCEFDSSCCIWYYQIIRLGVHNEYMAELEVPREVMADWNGSP